MSAQTTRRGFLRNATAAAALGLPDLTPFRSLLAAARPQDAPARIPFSPDLEPVVRLIEETPRENAVAVMAGQIRRGLTYRQFLAALFLAAVRMQDSHHSVYMMHSAHETSLELPSEERLIPLFWALDNLKWQQTDFPKPSLAPLEGALPSAERAPAEFQDAMQRLDRDRAERAVVALSRSVGPRQAMEKLWPHGCRNSAFIGHRAIALTSSWRALEAIGWRHGEAVLRFVVRDVTGQDKHYPSNVARADRHVGGLPPAWASGGPDHGATLEMVAPLRQGNAEEAGELACKQLLAGTGAQPIWDAVHVASAELLILHDATSGLAGRPLHMNTAANALRYAFGAASADRTRLLVLLQAVAWCAEFTGVVQGGKKPAKAGLTDLAGAPVSGTPEESVADIFSALPPKTYSWNSQEKKGAGYVAAAPADRLLQMRRVFALATEHPGVAPLFLRSARGWLAVKAVTEAHEYKLPAAMFEDYELVSPEWRPRLLAASARWLHGKQSPDSPVLRQAREALR